MEISEQMVKTDNFSHQQYVFLSHNPAKRMLYNMQEDSKKPKVNNCFQTTSFFLKQRKQHLF